MAIDEQCKKRDEDRPKDLFGCKLIVQDTFQMKKIFRESLASK